MGIVLGSNFDVQTALPLDSRSVVADLTARDAISALIRFEGMIVYVVSEGQHFALLNGITNSDWGPIAGGGTASDLVVDTFTGDGSDVTFTLSQDPITELNTWVFVSGVYQQKGTYSISGTTLTFSEAPPAETDNIEVMYTIPLSIGTPSNGTVTTAKLADDAVTTAKIDDEAVTLAKMSPAGYEVSGLINSSITSTSYADFTNNTLSFTTTGKLLEFGFKQDEGVMDVARADISATGSVDTIKATFEFTELTGSTILGVFQLGMRGHTTNSNWVFYGNPTGIKGHIQLAAGTYTIKCKAKVSTSNNLALTNCRMYVREFNHVN